MRSNPDKRRAVTDLATDFEALLRSQVPSSLPIKIDNMSNVDRVMRLPGTINFPKAEKIAKGQAEALAHIVVDYNVKCDLPALRDHVPRVQFVCHLSANGHTYSAPTILGLHIVRLSSVVSTLEIGIADTNSWYTHNVMFPLMGEAIDGNLLWKRPKSYSSKLSAVESDTGPGRGPAYFRRQWRSHLHSSRNGQRTLGSLDYCVQTNGMPTPWKDTVFWEKSYEEQLEAIQETKSNC